VPPCELAATVVRAAVSRAGLDPAEVGHAVFGHVIHTEVRDMYLGRVAAVNGGLPVQTPAFTLNRLCGSGIAAISRGHKEGRCRLTRPVEDCCATTEATVPLTAEPVVDGADRRAGCGRQ